MVRVVEVVYLENPVHNGIRFEVNKNLGECDEDLLTEIGKDLLKNYEDKQKS